MALYILSSAFLKMASIFSSACCLVSQPKEIDRIAFPTFSLAAAFFIRLIIPSASSRLVLGGDAKFVSWAIIYQRDTLFLSPRRLSAAAHRPHYAQSIVGHLDPLTSAITRVMGIFLGVSVFSSPPRKTCDCTSRSVGRGS